LHAVDLNLDNINIDTPNLALITMNENVPQLTQSEPIVPQATVGNDEITPDRFYKWLCSRDGGHNKFASQHKSQIVVLINHVGGIDNLLDKKCINDKFIEVYPKLKKHRPGTIQSYLTSLKHWLDFLTTNNLASKEDETRITKLHMTLIRWLAAGKSETKKRKLEKGDEDLEKLVTPAEVAEFNKSEPALAAVKYLGLVSAGKHRTITQQEFTTCRDFLMTRIIFGNANRSGVISKLTVENVRKAKMIDGHYVVSVADHKSAATHGPAK